MLACLGVALVTLAAVLIQVFSKGVGQLSLSFITDLGSSFPDKAGIGSALVGTLWVIGGLHRVHRSRRRGQRRLPGGVRGPQPLVQPLHRGEHPEPRRGSLDRLRHPRPGLPGARPAQPRPRRPRRRASPSACWSCRWWSSPGARRSAPCRPRSARARWPSGATKWQTIWKQVLPASVPGFATGVILAVSRAIGEAAPLIVVGGAVYLTLLPERAGQRLHGPAAPDLQLDLAAAGGVQEPGRGRDDRPARDPAGAERGGDLAPQQIREEVVGGR